MNLNNPLESSFKVLSDTSPTTFHSQPAQESLECALEALENSAGSFRESCWPNYSPAFKSRIFEHLQQAEKHAQTVLSDTVLSDTVLSDTKVTEPQKLDAQRTLNQSERLARIISSLVAPKSAVFT